MSTAVADFVRTKGPKGPPPFGVWDDALFNNKIDSFLEATGEYQDWRTVGVPLFDSEDLTDALLRIYLSLMPTKGWAANPQHRNSTGDHLVDIASLYRYGLWLPCVSRVVLAAQIDTRNDGLPDFAALPRFDRGHISFFASRKLKKPPRGWGAVPGSSAFYMSSWFMPQKPDDEMTGVNRRERGTMTVVSHPVSVVNDRIVPMVCGTPVWMTVGLAAVAFDTAAALSTAADFRHLWNVETEENTTGVKAVRTPLRLGVDRELVKSLFYARQLPVTESGRRRPILHWVRAHQRRVQAGTDIDIRKHLRGITEFEMDGFPFKITNPTKAQQ